MHWILTSWGVAHARTQMHAHTHTKMDFNFMKGQELRPRRLAFDPSSKSLSLSCSLGLLLTIIAATVTDLQALCFRTSALIA